jgi:nitrogen fixation NifU-like protein
MEDLDTFAQELQEEVLDQARALYTATVIDHWKHPRGFGALERPDGHARITGPCGDTMEVFLRISEHRVMGASFTTDGCITSIASGSMAVELATGRTTSEVRAISQDDILKALGGLPEESRHCALLASNTLRAAIDDHQAHRGASWKRLYRP